MKKLKEKKWKFLFLEICIFSALREVAGGGGGGYLYGS